MDIELGRGLLEVIKMSSWSVKNMEARVDDFETEHDDALSFADRSGLAQMQIIFTGSVKDELSHTDRRELFGLVERMVEGQKGGGEGLTMSPLCQDLLRNFERAALPSDVRMTIERLRETYDGRLSPEAQIALSHIAVAAMSHNDGLKNAAIRAEVFGLVTAIAGMPNGGMHGPSRGGTVLSFRKGKP